MNVISKTLTQHILCVDDIHAQHYDKIPILLYKRQPVIDLDILDWEQ